MHIHTFIADSAAEAVEKIRQELGPEAVVLNIRKLSAPGLAWLWNKPRIEVSAGVMEAQPEPPGDLLVALREELAALRESIHTREPSSYPRYLPPEAPPLAAMEDAGTRGARWSIEAFLERNGLARVQAQQVIARLHDPSHENRTVADQLEATRSALIDVWPTPREFTGNIHVFVGPPGAGKTTVLSKWLAQTVLVEGRPARVWRLDGTEANTAEALSVFGEILGVPVERFLPAGAPDPQETIFVDLPGVDWREATAITELGRRLRAIPGAQTHLVLNGAYEAQVLLNQARAFQVIPIASLIVTHGDEDPRWGKLWNLVLGTNYSVSFLSAGQKIPGFFQRADPEKILAPHFPRKTAVSAAEERPPGGWQTIC